MNFDTPEARRSSTRLVLCPACSSGLIYPIDIAASERRAIVSRRCPECEHRDVVATSPLAALIWCDRTRRIGDGLAALSEAIADGFSAEFALADPPAGEEPPSCW
jgi:hypothetical protein